MATTPTADIVKLANVQLPDASLVTLPAGWRRQIDGPIDGKPFRRRVVYAGSRGNIDAAYDAVRAVFDTAENLLSLSVQEEARSGVATISVEYSSHVGTASGGTYPDDNDPVAPDTYQLQSISVPTALAAHPAFAGISALTTAIDDAFAHGDRDYAVFVASGDVVAQKYLALRYAGVTQWEGTGFSWRVTRHYSTLADISAINTAATAAVNVGRVYAWGNVEGHLKILEPKYVYVDADGQTSAATSYQWRLAGVGVSRTSDALDLTWEYQGAWKWAAALYPGGSWSPAIP